MAIIGRVVIGDYEYILEDDNTAGACVVDTSKTSYGNLQASVTYQGETYILRRLEGCFWGCTDLTAAPDIPSSVTDMMACFYRCKLLTTAPVIPDGVTTMEDCFYDCHSLQSPPIIPDGVTNMKYCFEGCRSLTSAPVIPSVVVNMYGCFEGCLSLTTAPSIPASVEEMRYCFSVCVALSGTITVANRPTRYEGCFAGTRQPITVEVTNREALQTWQQVARTSSFGNVAVSFVSANPEPTAIITVTRVAAKGDITEYDYGQWAYVQVATVISTELAPDNVANTPTITIDGATTMPQQASGTANYVGWLSLGDEAAHTIGATPHDTYKTGQEVTVTLVPAYSPMEFHDGGDGASFGKHAVAGKLASAWPIESDGDVKATEGTVTHSLSGKQNILTAGNNIQINQNNEISATDTTYSAGTGINIINDTISVNIIDLVYPVGSIYMSVNSTSPATFLGGSWERITGKFLLGATDGGSSGASQAAGNTGGEATHTLTTGETPVKKHSHGLNNHTHSMSHNHKMAICRSNAEASGYGLTQTAGFSNRVMIETGTASRKWNTEASSAANTGGSTANTTETENTSATAHNNMPPFLAVYIWKRTA